MPGLHRRRYRAEGGTVRVVRDGTHGHGRRQAKSIRPFATRARRARYLDLPIHLDLPIPVRRESPMQSTGVTIAVLMSCGNMPKVVISPMPRSTLAWATTLSRPNSVDIWLAVAKMASAAVQRTSHRRSMYRAIAFAFLLSTVAACSTPPIVY